MEREGFSSKNIGGSKASFRRGVLNAIENTVNSIRVAPQWHFPGVVLGASGAFLSYEAIEKSLDGEFLTSGGIAFSAMVSVLGSCLSELAAVVYLDEYKRMKKLMVSHGWDERIVEQKVGYYCGQRAARMAANDAGYSREFNDFIRNF